MPTELRLLTEDDLPAHGRLMAEAFGSGRRREMPLSPEEQIPLLSPVYGIFDGARLAAVATVFDLRLTWGETDAPAGGVAGVACTADQRGRGHVARLIERSLRGMRERGQYLSGLYPFAYAFYRRHGWEWVGEKRIYTVPTSEIRAYPEGRNLTAFDGPEARETVQPVYDRFARRYRGMSTRRERQPNFWDDALKHRDDRTTYVQVYRDPATGQAEGYLTRRIASSSTCFRFRPAH